MADKASALPDYNNPPVNEVVFGVQFKKLDSFQTPHTGLLWEKLDREKFPKCQEMPPINHVLETPEGTVGSPSTIELFERPPFPRLLFFNSPGDQLIQVQQDRFLRNWRKLKADDTYPRYKTLYPEFQKSWQVFNSFLSDLGWAAPVIDQYELAYVNQMPEGQGWETLSDAGNVFKDFQCQTDQRFLPEPENISWRRIFRFPKNAGRLHVSMRLAPTKESQRAMLLELTARGYSDQKADEWFAMAHEWIVKGFADLTTDSVQKALWHLKQ
ncbi:MAG: TIGR04255 family protein [Sedimentisphaerales bacterium]|jgi:uncharacterized protein (TIGR04255 family)